MIEISARTTTQDELLVIALRELVKAIRKNGVASLNERLELSQFDNAEQSIKLLEQLAMEINTDQKFLYDNSEPLHLAIHIDGGLIQDVLPSKQIPMEIAAYDYEIDEADENDLVLISGRNDAGTRATVSYFVPSYCHAIDIRTLWPNKNMVV
ncbi:MAG: hypothetical protein EOO52_13325 [Gammaproteobacteria bacterium]|nr:MAG: hypothetical protein EOO52_13325 [Gammaproteobacteria bacterium]